MSPISTFLQSEQALKILGLPGLALLLAFAFYRLLVGAKLITSMGRNQSFALLLLIVVYFLIVSVLVIWVYRPERGAATVNAPAQLAAKAEEPTIWSKIDAFFDRAEMDTPLETFDVTFGPARGDRAIDPATTKLRKRTYFTFRDGAIVTVGHDERSVQWIAAFDHSQKLRIPTLNLGLAQDDGSVRRYDRLSDFDLAFVAEQCGGKVDVPGRYQFLAITPCYFGRPGSYNSFAFVFEATPDYMSAAPACMAKNLTEGALTAERVRQCRIGKEKPYGFVVAPDEALLPTAVATFIDTLEN